MGSSVVILVFLGLSVLELGSTYATDRQTDVRQKHRLMSPPYGGDGIITLQCSVHCIHMLGEVAYATSLMLLDKFGGVLSDAFV